MHNQTSSNQRTLVFQYAALLALFLNIIWLSWQYVDLTSGDTSYYYITARQFSENLTCNFAWSPIYTSLLGSFTWLNADPYFAILGHRIFILAVIAILIFEIARRIMNTWIAWFITAWWLCLPINFNSLYEVHLFALIPILIFWLILTCRQTVCARGWALGVLIVATFLVRNEFLIPLTLFSLASIAYDIRNPKRKPEGVAWSKYIKAYGLPIFISLLLIGGAYWRSTIKFPQLQSAFRDKHTLNVAQIYAFGYGQRHPEYKDNPWIGYHALMNSEFGSDNISMGKAFIKNPGAMMSHFLWNARLIPSGIQVGIFNIRSGSINPDYAPSKINRIPATILSLVAILIVVGALYLTLKSPEPAKRWLKQNIWLVIGLLSACAAVMVVMIMQRPRPSYMFPFTLTIMLSLGLAINLLLGRLKNKPFYNFAAAFFAGALIIFSPNLRGEYSIPGKKIIQLLPWKTLPPKTRPILSYYRLFLPYSEDLGALKAKAVVPGYDQELNSYLGLDIKNRDRRFMLVDDVLGNMDDTDAINQKFAALNIRYALFRYDQLSIHPVREFLRNPGDWTRVDTLNPNIIFLVKKEN